MRVAVVGATGNSGTSLLEVLADDPRVTEIVGIARRRPDLALPKTTWVQADMAADDLVAAFRGADAVVHLGWLFQPERDLQALWRTNVEGSSRVFAATAAAGVPALVYASSVAAYSPTLSPGPAKDVVDEDWPTEGVPGSRYSRQKSAIERRLDAFAQRHPGIRVVRLRPGLVFKREAAAGIRRQFLGPLLPNPLVRPDLLPLVPDVPALRVQGVHSRDLGRAYALAVTGTVAGAFNIAADPVLDLASFARRVKARSVRVPAAALRAVLTAAWRLRLEPTEPGWIELGLRVPLMSTARARDELGWTPRHAADDALFELLDGLREGAGAPTPPLSTATGGPLRVREFLSGIGSRS